MFDDDDGGEARRAWRRRQLRQALAAVALGLALALALAACFLALWRSAGGP